MGPMLIRSIWIGFDAREAAAFAVARSSIHRFNRITPVRALVLDDLRERGLYTRPTSWLDGNSPYDRIMIDELSKRDDYNGAVSTEFAISRFLTPILAKQGWALFIDCDMLIRGNVNILFERAINEFSDKALLCVHHDFRPKQTVKMDNQVQTQYARKNWSSVMMFNCEHPANKILNLDMVNSLPGRDLHRFCWLDDSFIGELGPEWNYLVGHSDRHIDPKIVHFTSGGPWMRGYENVEYADEWRTELNRWAITEWA